MVAANTLTSNPVGADTTPDPFAFVLMLLATGLAALGALRLRRRV